MEKLTITAYTDGHFQSEYKSALELPINPEKIKFEKGIKYTEDKQLGSLNGSNAFVRYQPERLSFECLLDRTNAMENDDEKKPIKDVIGDIEQRLYLYNRDGHRPSFVKIHYGDIIFQGQLTCMETEFILFNNSGIPLRAELKISLTGYCCQNEEKKKYSKNSPDVSRLVVLKEGQTLAALCYEIYGNSLLVDRVARFNNLNGFRNIPAGTEILFPALKKN